MPKRTSVTTTLQPQQQQLRKNAANAALSLPSNAVHQTTSSANERSCVAYKCEQHAVANLPFNWQSLKVSLNDRISTLCLNEYMSDVHFIVGYSTILLPNQTERIPAHKLILCVGSCVFEAMFNRSLTLNNDQATDNNDKIEVPDVEPSAFKNLLRFLYSDQVSLNDDNIMTTLYAAKKYCVLGLERFCVDFLKKNISLENALILLIQARMFDEPQLAAQCLDVIDKNASDALTASEFYYLDLDTLCAILKRDTLGIREIKLYNSVIQWAKHQCSKNKLESTTENIRNTLGQGLKLIRFPLMSQEEFASGPAQSGILNDKEIIQIFLYYNLPDGFKIDFDDEPRNTGKEYSINRFCEVENRWSYSGTSDRIRFKVDRRISIAGFGLYGSIREPYEYEVNIQLLNSESGIIIGQNESVFMSDGSTSTFRVLFKEPLEIQPHEYYVASAKLKGPDSFYGINGLRKITHECSTDGKVTFHFAYASDKRYLIAFCPILMAEFSIDNTRWYKTARKIDDEEIAIVQSLCTKHLNSPKTIADCIRNSSNRFGDISNYYSTINEKSRKRRVSSCLRKIAVDTAARECANTESTFFQVKLIPELTFDIDLLPAQTYSIFCELLTPTSSTSNIQQQEQKCYMELFFIFVRILHELANAAIFHCGRLFLSNIKNRERRFLAPKTQALCSNAGLAIERFLFGSSISVIWNNGIENVILNDGQPAIIDPAWIYEFVNIERIKMIKTIGNVAYKYPSNLQLHQQKWKQVLTTMPTIGNVFKRMKDPNNSDECQRETGDIVKKSLESNGSLAELRAKLRSDIFQTLQDPNEVKPKLPNENLLLNELILEYLKYNNWNCAASVLTAESGQPTTSLGRTFVAEQLNVFDDEKMQRVPLLYSMLTHFMSNSKNTNWTPHAQSK
ncbi:unnamed protein product [Didymodactylos carnosus]|uniref:Centrosomal protein 20 n=1 Tax=Didymodactylos carnosus TaxID=1234261 RepID=A0A8S2CND2_9BILA|nr:unnamed protein product [Didymodactylos carnosus]CAF3537532.1 unnamed protein product [Didymodactylos carnosus]